MRCGFEGVKGRPNDCKNNPNKYPKNHRPKLCSQCPLDPEIPKVADSYLSPEYIKFKQIKKKN